MKLRIPILLSLLMVVASAAAQRTFSPRFSIGGHAGITESRMSFSPKVMQSFLTGMVAGVTVRYTEERHVGIIAELNVAQSGWRESYDPGVEFRYRRTLTYLRLPLMTHIFFGTNRFKGFINLGPEVGYMVADGISANFDYANIGSVQGYPGGYRNNKQLAMDISGHFDYGITAGLGAEFFVNRHNSVTLEGRFYYGLGNIFPSTKKDYFSASRTMSILVTAGYWFRLR